MIKLSIVTVHLNDIERLVQTQRSLEGILDSGSFEWIVVDGGSVPESDAQMRLFEKVKNSATILVSEPDDGIFDAMNKGTRLATGEYVLYLNAGDLLHPDFDLDRVFQVCESKKPGMIWGALRGQPPASSEDSGEPDRAAHCQRAGYHDARQGQAGAPVCREDHHQGQARRSARQALGVEQDRRQRCCHQALR